MEDLLDIDFDGAAPASASTQTPPGVASPASPTGGTGNNLDDLLSLFGTGSAPANGNPSSGALDGLEGLSLTPQASAPPPPQQQKRANEDILGLF